MPTYRADLEYEGTRYRGWQIQRNARTVAGEVTRAVAEAGGGLREFGGAGRTDAGVHALGQTAHLRLDREIDPDRFRLAVNDRLPSDIHVRSLGRASDRFHARHDAVSRSYLYQIARRRTALAKRFVWWVRRDLDAEAMARAAAEALGRHDFRAFCEEPSRQSGTIVVVESLAFAEAGDLLLVRIVASHFLWKMVRRLVGSLVRVGAGDATIGDFSGWLRPRKGEDPGLARWTAPPSGLFLERVVYPDEPALGPLAPAMPVAAAPFPHASMWTGRSGPLDPKRASGKRGRTGRPPGRPSGRHGRSR